MEQAVNKVAADNRMIQAPMLRILLINKVQTDNKALLVSKVIAVKRRMAAISKAKALQEQQIVNKEL